MERPPSKSAGREMTEKIIEAGLNTVPIVGGPTGVMFAYAVRYTFDRRMTKWLEELAEAVDDLAAQVGDINFDTLADNDIFVDAVATATRAAERTHQEAKIEALRNAVLNSACPGSPDADTQAIFLRFVEDFAAAHLQILGLFNNPFAWCAERGLPADTTGHTGSRRRLIKQGIPQFADRREFCDVIVRDLTNAGLLANFGSLDTRVSSLEMYKPLTTVLGKQFIEFITDPRPHGHLPS
ncbi:hypothetical protein [Micromonospora arida]